MALTNRSEQQNILTDKERISRDLLRWFRLHGRDLPWRVKGKAHENPYMVWISEIMLQQTTVKTVYEYFNRWMSRFPTIQDLANAKLEDVLLVWQGLGYYTRAKKIYECAQILVKNYQGKIPENRDELLKLPGIGPYTASSICAFAFNKPETVVDGNVIRVLARLYGMTHEVTKEEIYQLGQTITPKNEGADYASAIMDLGATICVPNNPLCEACPFNNYCIAYQQNLTDVIPLIKKPLKKIKKGFVYIIQNNVGAFYIEKREGKGLLSGLYEFPWQDSEDSYPLFNHNGWKKTNLTVTHTFTHFTLTLTIVCLRTDDENISSLRGEFVPASDFKNYPFSTLMKKVMKHVIENKK